MNCVRLLPAKYVHKKWFENDGKKQKRCTTNNNNNEMIQFGDLYWHKKKLATRFIDVETIDECHFSFQQFPQHQQL